MLFTTDKQTLDDLNIYGKQGTDSIFSLFNRTKTLNGSKLLEEMFQHPLSDAEAINRRSGIISYLKVVQSVFPFSSELFDQAEQYLANTDERTKLSTEKASLEKRLTNIVAENADRQLIINGINALISIIRQLDTLLKDTLFLAGSPFKNDSETLEIHTLLTAEPISALLQENPKNKPAPEKLAAYDAMLRFRYRDTIQRILYPNKSR
jgi:hypothetical protein